MDVAELECCVARDAVATYAYADAGENPHVMAAKNAPTKMSAAMTTGISSAKIQTVLAAIHKAGRLAGVPLHKEHARAEGKGSDALLRSRTFSDVLPFL